MKEPNKYQAELNELNELIAKVAALYNVPPETLQGNRYQFFKELVDKATPKKPTISFGARMMIRGYYCPSCSMKVFRGKACSNNDCRQALDWSEDND